jgi:hypothetical protein
VTSYEPPAPRVTITTDDPTPVAAAPCTMLSLVHMRWLTYLQWVMAPELPPYVRRIARPPESSPYLYDFMVDMREVIRTPIASVPSEIITAAMRLYNTQPLAPRRQMLQYGWGYASMHDSLPGYLWPPEVS